MPEGANTHNPSDPMEQWKQWYDTSSKMWLQALNESKEMKADPYGLYQSWLKNFSVLQEQVKSSPQDMMQFKAIWKQWFDTIMGAWRKAAENTGDPFGFTTLWLEIMQETGTSLLAAETFPPDPFTFLRIWYDATSEKWSKAVEDIIKSEQFMKFNSSFLENFSSFSRLFRHANEEYFRNLQLPTRSDFTRMAELIIALEEKVDRVDDALADLQNGNAQLASSESITGLEGRLVGVESKLDTLPSALNKSRTLEELTQRLDKLESKLDQVLTALQKIETRKQPEITKAKQAAPRRASKSNA